MRRTRPPRSIRVHLPARGGHLGLNHASCPALPQAPQVEVRPSGGRLAAPARSSGHEFKGRRAGRPVPADCQEGIPFVVPPCHVLEVGLLEPRDRRKHQMAGVRRILVHLDGEPGRNRQVQLILDRSLRVGEQPGAECFVPGGLLHQMLPQFTYGSGLGSHLSSPPGMEPSPRARVAALDRGRPVSGGDSEKTLISGPSSPAAAPAGGKLLTTTGSMDSRRFGHQP